MPIARRTAALAATLLAAPLFTAPAARAQEAQAVAQAVAALHAAMVAVDRPALERLTHAGLSYGHSAGRIENRQEYIANLEARTAAFRFINTSDQTVSVVGDDAIVRHVFIAETVSPAAQVTPVRIGILQVWRREAGAWQLLARQAYRL